MLFIKNLFLVAAKLITLLLVVSFEKVVGLPVIFVTLLLIFFVNEKSFYKYIFLVFGAMFLAVVYTLSFSYSLLLLVFLVLAVSYGGNIISSDINRVLFIVYSLILLVAINSQVVWDVRLLSSLILSSVVAITILMKTLFFKYGLTGRITGRGGNFFR